MFRRAQTQTTGAEVKWLLLSFLVAALLIAFSCTVAGAVEPAVGTGVRPAQLPDDMDQFADPMAPNSASSGRDQQVVRVWMVLEEQRSGHLDRAAHAWTTLQLPAETDVYRHLAMAQALLGLGRLEQAELELQTARDMAPNLSLVHYYTGVWRLEMAEAVRDDPDSVDPLPQNKQPTRLASQGTPKSTRSMYRVAAMMSLEKALQAAGDVDYAQPLLPGTAHPGLTLEPTVRDLLEALYADRYVANAHNALGSLYLESDWPEAAETHLDAAAELGAFVGFGYSDLGAQYERQGRHADAMRAYAKAMRHDGGLSLPAQRALESLRNSLWNG